MVKTRDKLIALGPETLADALLELAGHYDEADDLVERLVATDHEKVVRFRARLTDLKQNDYFYDWRHVGGFARELEGLLADLAESVEDSKIGVELMALFFESDRDVFESCDDSSGEVGDIFRQDAAKLFSHFGAGCLDKTWLGSLIIKLLADDGYGVRDSLLECGADYLPEDDRRELIEQFWGMAEKDENEYNRHSWYRCVEELAKQLGDAQLFEKARLASVDEPGTGACLDIASVYLKNGDPQTALAWIERDKDPNSFRTDKRDDLLQDIYGQLGDFDKAEELAWKRFRCYRCLDGLDDLLAVIGTDTGDQEQRQVVIAGQVKEVLAQHRFNAFDARFLLETNNQQEAETYLLQSVEQFNGDFYGELLELAQAMEHDKRYLVATMLYRALLDSILKRGYTKSYSHGVRYLKKLDTMALVISNWQSFVDHTTYKKEVRSAHGRKYSFWRRYDK